MFQISTLHATLSLSFAAALVAPLQAGELRREQLPAGTEWVVHADFEAIVASRLYREAHAAGLLDGSEPGEYPDFRRELLDGVEDGALQGGELKHLMLVHDFDPLTDFQSMTLFGTLAEDDDAVVLFELGAKAQAILDDLRAKPEHLTVGHEGLTFDAWLEDGNEVNGYLFARPAAEDGSVLVAVSEERETLARAARVLTGEAPSMSSTTTQGDANTKVLAARADAGSFLYVEIAGGVPGMTDDNPTSCVFSSARSMRLDVGEEGGLFTAQLALHTDDAREARRVAQVVQGVVALASLAAANDEDAQALSELADAVDVRAVDTELVADFEMDSFRIVELAKQHREQRKERREARKERRESRRDK